MREFKRGSRRGSRSGGRPEHRHFLPPEPEVTDGEEVQGGTPDDVFQLELPSAVRRSVRGMARLLQTAFELWCEALGDDADALSALNDEVKPAVDALWRASERSR